jgi:protein involved in polysaccharide export with SLBB domain
MTRHRQRFAPAALVAVVLCVLASCGPTLDVKPLSPAEIVRMQTESAEIERRGYRIEPGDTLLIKYRYHPEMDQEAMVRPDGTFTATGVGVVPAAGMTSVEIASQLKEKTSHRLRDPEVVVTISKYMDRGVYVGGEVGKPQMLVYRKGLTPLQAVMAAGGFLPTARVDSVIIVRPNAGAQNVGTNTEALLTRKIDLGRVMHKGEPEPLSLLPQDVIYVPRTPIANADLWMKQYFTDLFPFLRISSPMPF